MLRFEHMIARSLIDGSFHKNGMRLPRALGIIPDGNRRWAEAHGVSYAAAYARSVRVFGEILPTLFSLSPELRHVAVYVLSRKNLDRPADEVDAILDAGSALCRGVLPELCADGEICVHPVTGLRHDSFCPKSIEHFLDAAARLSRETRQHDRRHLYLVAANDPLADLCAIARRNGRLAIADLPVPHELDCVVRTAGESRLSNFLPLQSGYAELIVLPEYFPDLSADSASTILGIYAQRMRKKESRAEAVPTLR